MNILPAASPLFWNTELKYVNLHTLLKVINAQLQTWLLVINDRVFSIPCCLLFRHTWHHGGWFTHWENLLNKGAYHAPPECPSDGHWRNSQRTCPICWRQSYCCGSTELVLSVLVAERRGAGTLKGDRMNQNEGGRDKQPEKERKNGSHVVPDRHKDCNTQTIEHK